MQIKNLFDPSKDIYRTIEKVITYNASQETRLKAEITEYIVTESIEEQFERLLSKMQLAMETGGENEVGVWVSGFYGSGKSSFTKYLGLALDQSIQIEGARFLKYLQDRVNKPQTRALLATVANRFPTAVVLLDLASEMLAGATMEEVSTVLYYKVLQWAGYSRNLKVAALERKLKKDGRYDEFTARIQSDLGVDWCEVQNDPLVIDSLIPQIAYEMYPALFKTPSAFNTEATDFVRFEVDRVQEMIEIVREASGKQYIVFIIDEVGQYVGSRPNLILNLDGLAKNLKGIGSGKAWIMGTAQQTLTEDDPRASLNSPELYKLKDRFPIQIDLESSDIREICYRRLLGKSPQGEQTLGALFDQHGPELRFNTRLQDAKYYDADFDKITFTNLYPFLPAHFDILLHLLGALARSTGGIGLRSAIKVIQDILIEGPEGQSPVADQPVGWLATTVTLYDALEKDIRRAEPSIHKAVDKVLIRFPGSPLHHEVAKTVAVLQILKNMPVTARNVASLIHPSLEAASRQDQVDTVVKELISDGYVPFGEKDGNLCFFSEKINEIDLERASIIPRGIETRRIQNEALKEAFSPLPATRLHGTMTVTSGLKALSAGMLASLAGEREAIQMQVEFIAPEEYEAARTRLVDESRQRSAQQTIFLLGRTAEEIAHLAGEIYRSLEIVNRHRSDPDQEVKDYCASQTSLAEKWKNDLERRLSNQLSQGSFIFRGQTTAVESLNLTPLEAAKKLLANVAEQVFDRYNEAPVRADTGLAENFLRLGNLTAISIETDPLGLVQFVGGAPRINANHKALTSIRDYIERFGSLDGKRLSEHFSDAPFGWSPDTLRYLVAAMLVNGEIKLKISGREIRVSGNQAIEGLRTNNAFKTVGISLRDEQLDPTELARAAQRLTDLTGESVIPLEQEISKAAAKSFPGFQQQVGPLEEKLKNLGLPGVEVVRELNEDLAEILETDASDVPQRLGSPNSTLYDGLKWAGEVMLALKNGLETTIQELREHWKEIKALPDIGAPGRLKTEVEETLQQISDRLGQDNFYEHNADLNTALTAIRNHVRAAATQLAEEQGRSLQDIRQSLVGMPEWQELMAAEQTQTLGEVDSWAIHSHPTLGGIKQLLNHEYTLRQRADLVKKQIVELAQERIRERVRETQTYEETILVEEKMTLHTHLNELLQRLQQTQQKATYYKKLAIHFTIQSDETQD